MSPERRKLLFVCGAGVTVVTLIVLVLLLAVNVIPANRGFNFLTGVMNGGPSGTGTVCGSGQWVLNAPANSKLDFDWYVTTYSSNFSNPGQGYANLSIVDSSGTQYSMSGFGGSGGIAVPASSTISVSYVLCTNATVATLVFYGNVTTWRPLL